MPLKNDGVILQSYDILLLSYEFYASVTLRFIN